MGAGTDDFIKYPKTPHLWGSKLADDDKMLSEMLTKKMLSTRNVDFVWESKLDGTNVGFSFDEDGEIKIQNRGHLLKTGEHPQYDIFRNWAYTHMDRLRAVAGVRYIVFGEWCYAVHTVRYKTLPHYFMEFDIWDREEKKFLSTPIRRKMLAGVVADGILAQVPVVHPQGEIKGYGDTGILTLEAARKLMVSHGPMYGEVAPEGLYLKVEKKGEVVERYKLVRDEFIQKIIDSEHWKYKAVEVQGLAEGVDIFDPKPKGNE